MNILVIDIGGTNIKFTLTGTEEKRRFPSGREMTAEQMVAGVIENTKDWNYDGISIGYPGPVVRGKILRDPINLGKNWVDFDFQAAFGKPVKIINDAAMQALGSYEGDHMLFLGLGTGLGVAVVYQKVVVSLELSHLPYRKGQTYEEYLGVAGMKRLGKKKWRKAVFDVVRLLKDAMVADYVVLGGGNAKKLDQLPEGARLGDNRNAFVGGCRLWQEDPFGSNPCSQG